MSMDVRSRRDAWRHAENRIHDPDRRALGPGQHAYDLWKIIQIAMCHPLVCDLR